MRMRPFLARPSSLRHTFTSLSIARLIFFVKVLSFLGVLQQCFILDTSSSKGIIHVIPHVGSHARPLLCVCVFSSSIDRAIRLTNEWTKINVRVCLVFLYRPCYVPCTAQDNTPPGPIFKARFLNWQKESQR
ncbi:unnamed protein product [Ectocarpus sp. 12 AP-2014]